MKRRQFMLCAHRDRWRIIACGRGAPAPALSVTPAETPAQTAGRLAEALRTAGYKGGDVLVAVASELCFSASVPTDGLPRRGRARALLYRLEEKLPRAAEDLLAGFAVHNGEALGIAAPLDGLRDVLAALNAHRIRVAGIVPLAMLTLQSLLARRGGDANSCDTLLWQDDGQLELVTIADGQPVRWLTLGTQPADLALALASQVLTRRSGLRVLAAGVDEELGLENLPDVQVLSRSSINFQEAASTVAADVLSGRISPLVELRGGTGQNATLSDRLRRPIVWTVAMIALLFVCVMASSLWRAGRYASVEAQADAANQALFRRLFPGKPIPAGIESRLRSALRELSGQDRPRGAQTAGTDALMVLNETLTRLPADTRFRIAEIDISSGRLQITGDVRQHTDADLLAAALRRSPQLTVDDPQTQQTPDGYVQFTLSGAARQTAAAPTGAGQ